MKRALYQDLLDWKDAPRRKPLILDGARQTGKTWLLREFGEREFRTTHYLNFETDPRICTIFAGDLRPGTILPLIELHTGVAIDRARDVIVLDEIQTCPRALTAFKYFLEQLPEMAVCAAGSLIGLAGSEESWPVGKVTTLRLHPLSFSEFLEATDQLLFSHFLRFSDVPSPLPEAVHQKLIDTLWLYLFVGGMPEAVARYVDSGVLDAATVADVGRIHADLVTGYRSDFAKHAGTVNAHHLSRVFDAVPAQLSRSVDGGSSRFTFKDVMPNSRRFRDLAGPIDWLAATGLIIQSMLVDDPGVPLAAHRRESMFKLFLLDVGLLHHILGVPAASIVSQTWGSYKGYVAECGTDRDQVRAPCAPRQESIGLPREVRSPHRRQSSCRQLPPGRGRHLSPPLRHRPTSPHPRTHRDGEGRTAARRQLPPGHHRDPLRSALT